MNISNGLRTFIKYVSVCGCGCGYAQKAKQNSQTKCEGVLVAAKDEYIHINPNGIREHWIFFPLQSCSLSRLLDNFNLDYAAAHIE